MARIALIPKHVSGTFTMAETFDLVMTLRAAQRDYGDSFPESLHDVLEAFENAYDGDLPQAINHELDGGDEVTA